MVEVTGKRFSLNMISAVGTQGEFRFMVHDGTVTAVVFREFLRRLMIGALRRIQKLPELVKSFFRQPECQYAAM